MQRVLLAKCGAVHRVVCDQRNRRAVRVLQADQADLPVRWSVRVQPERDVAIDIASAPIDIGRRKTGAYS